jgi:hypothetical protein
MSTGFESADIDHGAASSPDMLEQPPRTGGAGRLGPHGAARLLSVAEVVGLYAICIFAALALSALIVQLTGGDSMAVFNALLTAASVGPAGSGRPSAWPHRCWWSPSVRSSPTGRAW